MSKEKICQCKHCGQDLMYEGERWSLCGECAGDIV